MSAEVLFYIIIAVFIIGFVFNKILEFLNASWFKKPVPEILNDIYDSEKYTKQQNYLFDNHRFGIFTSSFNFIVILGFLFLGGFAYVDKVVSEITNHYILSSLLFFGIIFLLSDIISTPFDIYDTFVIEEKYGFNKTTPKIYVFDKLKAWIITSIIGGGLLSLIIWIYNLDPVNFWLYAWGVIIFFNVFFLMFYSVLIVPLFNKQTPLEEGALKQAIIELGKKAGFNIDKIFIIDGSKRSTKANAYFTGFGPKKRIVLYDTLVNQMNTDEILAVISHEIGHYKHKDIYKSLFVSILETGVMLYVFGLLANSEILSQSLGVSEPKFHIALITFGILYSPFSTVLGIISSYFSRKAEFNADNFAANLGYSISLISALKKLSSNNLSNLTHHPVVVKFTYSHPPLYDRVLNLLNR
ncbi:MAG: M48 family metallopeptidase [Bacteroidales bacterium]|nr:M48 family metallopeptidase [Bacteroidales bacterium]HOL98347.1 M48 family metallopeptidase [Bacteroidales bacterium]HOM35715.1 M48 family metallopeptidase [Bacteroidales bacterium]HPD23145.1 M48 family metallopeptidase [Bacteroidales bacterium]HRS99074.1 M48 family metallopeptidase [Bacteroidales bacterium]